MNIFGGTLLYLGSVTTLLAATIIAAGTVLSDPAGGPSASAATALAATPPPVRARDAKSAQKPTEGVQDVAKMHPVAPPASTISVRPYLERPTHAGKPAKRAATVKRRAAKVRPVQARPVRSDIPGAFGLAGGVERPARPLPSRR